MARTSSLAWVLLALCLSRPALADKPTTIPRATTPQVHQVVDRATKYLQAESAAWLSTRKCAACHHVPMPLWALSEADRQGYTVDKQYVADTFESLLGTKEKLRSSRIFPDPAAPPDPRPQGRGLNMGLPFLAFAAQTLPSLTEGQKQSLKLIAEEIVRKQQADGSWKWFAGLRRPPINESQTTDAAWILLALEGLTGPGAPKAQREALAKASAWLAAAQHADLHQDKALKVLLGVRSGNGKASDGHRSEPEKTPPAADQRGPSIKDVYKDYFLVGMAGDLPGTYSGEELGLVKGNFSIVTPENCMKPAPVHPSEDTWRFARPDALVKWCSDNHLAIHGHTLVWHAQTGNWFFRDGDKAAVTRRLKDHIRTLVGRYKGKIRSWDVVNEAISDGGDAQTARTENLRNSSWLRALGPEYIALAFRFAHEADPDAELYYNDYGIETGPKHESSMVLLKRLIKDGVPIHGVGIQGHWRTGNVPYAAVDRAIADYASLGLKVSISELDVTIRGASGGQFGPGPGFGGRGRGEGPPPSAQDLKAQADAYARLFAIFLKHKDVMERITFWGLSDRRSWRFGQRPLLFDSKNQRKPAYTAVVNALLHPNPDLAAPRSPARRPAGEAGAGTPTTYCNPISLPNYPLGRRARDVTVGAPAPQDDPLWLVAKQQQFRELADVSVLWHEGAWYMYPSVDMAWVSRDGGATWQHHPLNVRDVGYAPTIVKHKGKFLLMASGSSVYTADSPLGPFKELGPVRLPGGLPSQIDPMLFSDDDGRLFYYWGCTPTEGIFGVELDSNHPSQVIGQPARMIAFEPDKFPWQRLGDWNEQPARGWVEGAWMFKRNGKYYLTYSAAGTENRTYAMGCAVSKSPLGPFVPQKNNPILRSTTGLITGTGHGCVVEGPHHSLWAFYTMRAAVVHGFERRLGMDPASIGEDGELHVSGASSLPQRLPTASKGAEPTGWLPLNAGPRTVGSSDAPNLSGRLAVDDDLRTWWQPAADDKAPTLTSNLTTPNAVVRAVRVIWRDVGLNTKQGAEAGAFRYKVEVQTAANTWATVIDRSRSTEDLLIDYRECPATPGTAARLVIVGAPAGITPGVAEFTVFGEVRKQ